jgi:hypothetical protein
MLCWYATAADSTRRCQHSSSSSSMHLYCAAVVLYNTSSNASLRLVRERFLLLSRATECCL